MTRFAQRGFTLLEVVIAIAIFAGIFVVAQQMFSQAVDSRDRLNEAASRLETQQLLLTWLTMDIEQIFPRPVRDAFGQEQPALLGVENAIAFTRAGWANPFDLRRRSELQRVEYLLDDDQRLIRRHWPALDVNPGAEPRETVMMENVQELHFRYLNRDQDGWSWVEFWPPLAMASKPVIQQQMPKSIEVRIVLEDGTELHRFYRTVDNPLADPI